MGREQYLLPSSSQTTKQNMGLGHTAENPRYIITSFMSSKNPSQLREHPPGLEPGMDGYNLIILHPLLI
jgi:hypothetical protein